MIRHKNRKNYDKEKVRPRWGKPSQYVKCLHCGYAGVRKPPSPKRLIAAARKWRVLTYGTGLGCNWDGEMLRTNLIRAIDAYERALAARRRRK